MATIRFSDVLISYTINGIASQNSPLQTSSANAYSLSGTNIAANTLLIVYKGTQENFATFTDRATRASDVLITFSLPTFATANINVGQINTGAANAAHSFKIGVNLTNQAAAASGTATWFLMCRAGTTSLTDKAAFLGSVGTTGSGSDMEIPSTAIISGNNYQSNGVYFNFPQNWTV